MTTTTQPRQISPEELATITKACREGRGWTQEVLAELAGISSRTIQRVEEGKPSSPDVRRALARAFELDDLEAFNKLHVFPTAEDLKAEQERFHKERITLKAAPLMSGRRMAELAESNQADLFSEGDELPRAAQEQFADLTDYWREYRECRELYTAQAKLEVYDELERRLQELQTLGARLFFAQRKVVLRSGSDHPGIKAQILYIVAFRASRQPETFAVMREVQFN